MVDKDKVSDSTKWLQKCNPNIFRKVTIVRFGYYNIITIANAGLVTTLSGEYEATSIREAKQQVINAINTYLKPMQAT